MKNLFAYFTNDIWNVRLASLSALRSCWIRFIRICVLTVRFFFHNDCTLHAAFLTYYSLLAIVPVFALIFGIAKGYGYDVILKEKLMESMQGHEAVAQRLIEFSDHAIQNASGGLVAGIGVFVLIWTSVRLLASIENSFNQIWGVQRGRSWGRKFCDYLTLLVIWPFLLTVLATTSSIVVTNLRVIAGYLPFSASDSMAFFVAKTVNFVLAWFIFTFIYIFVPNTKVKFKPAVISGILTGTCYLLLQIFYVIAQTRLTSYNAIYGSFAALPLFLIWMNLGWILTIFGAQLAFAIQNVSMYEMEPQNGYKSICNRRKQICAVQIVEMAAKALLTHIPPYSAVQFSRTLEIPILTTRALLFDLCRAGVLIPVSHEKNDDDSYQINLPSNELTPLNILKRLDGVGTDSTFGIHDDTAEKTVAALWKNPEKDLNRVLGK